MAATKYASDGGSIHSLQLSAGKAAVASNTVPSGAVDSSIKAKISKSNREFGLRPRGVTMQLSVTGGSGANAVTKIRYMFLPILEQTVFDGATFAIGTTHTYKGATWTVSAKVAEDY
jgi:hypothetical protein